MSSQQGSKDKEVVLRELLTSFDEGLKSRFWELMVEAADDEQESYVGKLLSPRQSSEDIHFVRGYIAGIRDTLAIPAHSIKVYQYELDELLKSRNEGQNNDESAV